MEEHQNPLTYEILIHISSLAAVRLPFFHCGKLCHIIIVICHNLFRCPFLSSNSRFDDFISQWILLEEIPNFPLEETERIAEAEPDEGI